MADNSPLTPRKAATWFLALSPERRLMPTLAALALLSGGLIAGALFLEHVMGVQPCKLCLVQREPHYAIFGLSLAGLALGAARFPARTLAGLRAGLLAFTGLAFLYSGGYGVYQTGAERGWWPGPADCTGAAIPESMEAFKALLAGGEEVVRCDVVNWSFLGLSLASYNALISFPAALFVLFAAAAYFRARMAAPREVAQHG